MEGLREGWVSGVRRDDSSAPPASPERFTSKMAFQTMIDSGLKKKDRQNKGLVDEISATILLQGYLEFNS